MADAPGPDALVVPSSGGQVQHSARVPDNQGADLMLGRPSDDGFGGLMVGLPHPAGMPGRSGPLSPSVLLPPA
ncbi:MAG TPA: hypothetical protein VGM53_26135 [Streptosporangiaceae bacterium]